MDNESRKRKIQVPVGVEKLLYHAARDDDFRELLLSDRERAATEAGVTLRSSERAALEAIPVDTLVAMIDSIVPTNPRRRKFMGLVAAAATSLAAGTAVIACDDDSKPQPAGVGPDTDVDGDTDSDTDTDDTDSDTSTVDTDTGPPETDGMTIGDAIDGDFSDWPGWNRGGGGKNG
jgi:hypothetical protein